MTRMISEASAICAWKETTSGVQGGIMKVPIKSLYSQIDEVVEVDIDVWVEDKQREPEQMEFIDEAE